MINKVKNIREKIILLFLFIGGFFISFFRATEIYISEDLGSSIAVFKFVEYPSVIPLMSNQLNAMQFFALPFYWLFGFHDSSLRIAQAFFLGLAVLLFYLFIKEITKDKKIALLSSLLLVSYPYFILMKFSEYPFTGFLSILVLFLFSLVKKRDDKLPLILLGLVSGIAFYYKTIMGAFVFSLLIGFLIFEKDNARKKLWCFKKFPFFLVSVIIGSLPWILWNIYSYPWGSLSYFAEGAKFTSENLISLIFIRIDHFVEIFLGSPEKYHGELPWIGGSILTLFILSIAYIQHRRQKKDLIYPFTLFIYILLSTIQVNTLIPKHLYIIIPLIITTIGVGLSHLKDSLPKSKEKFVYIAFIILVLLSFFNTQQVLSTPNNYNFYRTDYEIGYVLRGKEVDKIYVFESRNFGLCDSLIFTSQKKNNVFLAAEAFRGGDEVFDGHWNGGEVGDFGDARSFSLSLEDMLEQAEEGKNIYIDVVLFADDLLREEGRNYFNSMITEKGYQRIEMERDLKRAQYGESLKRRYVVWVPEGEKDLIEELKTIK